MTFSRLRVFSQTSEPRRIAAIACPSPDGGTDTNPGCGTTTTSYTTTVTGTVTASPPGAAVSALTTPDNSANKPATARPDGSFTLQVTHPGTFQIKVANTCSKLFTTAGITASADGFCNAGALQLTLEPEPAGTARCSITRKSDNSCKLTAKECVREIQNSELSAFGTIITTKASAEIADRVNMITEISLPSTLTKIGESAFNRNLEVR